MRRRAVVVGLLTLALATGAASVSLAVAAWTSTDAVPSASASPSPSASIAASADDYCYVEAMIFYRVEERDLAETLLRRSGMDAGASGFATGIAARDEDELEDLRAWYLSWADARPAQPPTDGPCGGHGADHAQMPGMPSWSAVQAFVDAEHPEAERRFAEILRAQNTGMIALVRLILDGDPHPAVVESARAVLAGARSDEQVLQGILAGLP